MAQAQKHPAPHHRHDAQHFGVHDEAEQYANHAAMPRDREIIAAYKRGESLLTIADRFDVTCADVQRIVARVASLGRVLAELPIDADRLASGRRGLIDRRAELKSP